MQTIEVKNQLVSTIALIDDENQILIGKRPFGKTFENLWEFPGGKIEKNETAIQSIIREVKEETGIDVTNIRYFGSQPWAFPSSMMMGFLADYAGGVLKPDYSELSDAQWFTKDSMPEVAPKGTIARALIEQTIEDIAAD